MKKFASSALRGYTATQAKGLNAYADYLEGVFELSKLPNTADTSLRDRVRRRFDELRDAAAQALSLAGFGTKPSEIAMQVVKERRQFRRQCAIERRRRREEKEMLLAS